jgi:putative PIN family toxin of toxin-antitoxin system
MRRLVLDTNILVSALLFQGGRLGWLRHAWQSGQVTPLLCRSTTDELLRVLAYPKFRLEHHEIIALLGDLLPHAEPVEQPASPPQAPRCRDPDDQVFIDLFLAADADALITGDDDLLVLSGDPDLRVLTAAQLREALEPG